MPEIVTTTETTRQTNSHIAWAILPAALDAGTEAFFFLFEPPEKPKSYYTVDDNGIATVSIMGPIGRRSSGYSFRGVDSEVLVADLKEIAADDSIKGVVVALDSPGGTVDGAWEVMGALSAIDKPTTAYVDGMAASAAYLIGSAADRIYASKTSSVGSIGVIATHRDHSEMDKQDGIKTTLIFNGKFKAMGSGAEPLSPEAKAYIQERVDAFYAIFVDDVSSNRNMSPKSIRAMESKIYLATEAKEVGLIDGVSSMTQAYNETKRSAGIMNITELRTEFPEVYREAMEIGKEGFSKEEALALVPEAIEAAKEEATKAERTRSHEITEAAFPGQEEVAAKLIAEGVSADAAIRQLMVSQKKAMAEGRAAIQTDDLDDLAPNGEPADGQKTATDKTDAGNKLNDIAQAIMTKTKVGYGDAFDQAKAENPKLVEIYLTK